MVYLTVPQRGVCFFVVTNLFICTDTVNDDTVIVLCYCGITHNNLSVIPECVRNVHHLSQLKDCLEAVALEISLDESRLILVVIPQR